MCRASSLVYSLVSLSSLFQSIVYLVLSLTGILVYTCVVTVRPYQNEKDFFLVTLIKLYFEGPDCIPDGSYLGKFNEKYKHLGLLSHDKMFAINTGYAILYLVYFFLSIKLFINRNKPSSRQAAFQWSLIDLFICIADFFMIFFFMVNFFILKNHVSSNYNALNLKTYAVTTKLTEVPYISLFMAILSSKFVVFWIVNMGFGVFFFLNYTCRCCCSSPTKVERKVEIKPRIEEKQKRDEKPDPKPEDPSVSILSGKSTNTFDIRSNPDYFDYKNSMEAITRFNLMDQPNRVMDPQNRYWSYTPTEAHWRPPKSHSSREWNMRNEAFVNDEGSIHESEKQPDFDHDLKNFESGSRVGRSNKAPVGKPVSIPIPPPFPDGYSKC